MDRILVTGAIASGKSEVCKYIKSLGYPVYDSDSRTKSLYATVPGLVERIESELETDFSGLGIIFTDEDKRRKLESIVHPLVVDDFNQWADCQSAAAVFFESAIALEKPLFKDLFDHVIIVKAPYATRLSRNSKVSQRDSIQNPDDERADYVIVNDSDLETLHDRTLIVLKELIKV